MLTRPGFLLRAEAMMVLVVSCVGYGHWFPHRWVLFVCLFLVPDVSLLLSMRGPGALASATYNAAHSYVPALVLGVIWFARRDVLPGEVSLIWISHIALDRALGFGLKYPTSFAVTHLQRVASVLDDGAGGVQGMRG